LEYHNYCFFSQKVIQTIKRIIYKTGLKKLTHPIFSIMMIYTQDIKQGTPTQNSTKKERQSQ
jgi:hypothetical protein